MDRTGGSGVAARHPRKEGKLYVHQHRIPRIIHQTWKVHDVHSVFEPFIRSWLLLHPDWEYRFWTDEMAADFMRGSYPEYWEMYESFNGIQRSDTIRYFILYHYGGVYADLDMEALQPFDALHPWTG